MKIRKGMYGLPQAGILANKLLKKRLAKQGYYELPHTPGLWKHISRPIAFSLVVDDFGVKYVGEQHARHLVESIKKEYTVNVDWAGELYCGIKLAILLTSPCPHISANSSCAMPTPHPKESSTPPLHPTQ